MIERMYETAEIADILHTSKKAVRDKIYSKELPSLKIGKKHLVKESVLYGYIESFNKAV